MSLHMTHPDDAGIWEMYKALPRDVRAGLREMFTWHSEEPHIKVEILAHEYWLYYEAYESDLGLYFAELQSDE